MSDRDAAIDTFFDGMDAEDLALLREVLAADVRFESPSGDLEGLAGMERYFEDLRGRSDTTHEVTRRVHGADAVVAEGVVIAPGEDGPTETEFCDVFEFDADGRISRIGVYLAP